MSRLQQLLKNGFFPSQMPPCFTSESFALKATAIKRKLNKSVPNGLPHNQCQLIRPEHFSVARAGHVRRPTSIVNPIAHFYLADTIASNWNSIYSFLKKSGLSKSTPKLVEGRARSILFTSVRELSTHKILSSAGYKYVLITDVSQFFPSIYTHAIEWALYGKDKIKKVKDHNKSKTLGSLLDKHLRHCQSNQTIGIPIGPDTSHIIAELLGVAIDMDFSAKLLMSPAGFRYVDDFYLFFDTKEKAEAALAKLSTTLSHYELKINSLKTKIIKAEELSEDTWKYPLQQFVFESETSKQPNNINHYFDLAFNAARAHSDENVMLYAIKRAKKIIVKRKTWHLFESYLCRTALAFPNTLQEISQILTTYDTYNFPLNKDNLTRTLNQIISDHAGLEHHSEIAWALWLCTQLNLRLGKEASESLIDTNSSVCLILAYELQQKGLLANVLKKKQIKAFTSPECLWKTNWLFAYEAGRRTWFGASRSKISSDPFFGILDKYEVSFYDGALKNQVQHFLEKMLHGKKLQTVES